MCSTSRTLTSDQNYRDFCFISKLVVWTISLQRTKKERIKQWLHSTIDKRKNVWQPTVIKNVFTMKFYTRKANIVTFKKCIIVLLLRSCNKVYLCPSLNSWPWRKKKMIFCTLLSFSAKWNTIPSSIAETLLKPTAKKSMKKTLQSSFYYWNGTGMIEEPWWASKLESLSYFPRPHFNYSVLNNTHTILQLQLYF